MLPCNWSIRAHERQWKMALDVDKVSCYLIPLTTMTKKMEPIRLALEKMMPVHAIINFPNPASFSILYLNLKKKEDKENGKIKFFGIFSPSGVLHTLT